MLVAFLVTSCSSRPPGYPAAATSAQAGASVAATATRAGELGSLTAHGIVAALQSSGFAAPNPVDTTAQECPTAGCDQSVVTDTLRVKSFSSTAAAQSYAADNGLFQTGTIVVAFAPPVTPADQDRYRRQIAVLTR
jgi:hypothetical protein